MKMPSAANVKIDKQISSENALADSSCTTSTPLRQAITIIEHKIRNLEKRKAKLESYKDLQNAGKELNSDQKTAVAKYNEVVQTLDFARDLCKQFLGIATTSEKDAKKQAKKEAAARNQADLAKLREVLLIQDALNILGCPTVREDFLNGRRGAAQLTQADLELLDELYPAVTPKHEAGNPTAFTNEVQAAAEHLLAVVDGKPKEIFAGSYSQIKEILGKIHESGYLDQVHEEEEQEAVYVESYSEQEPAPVEPGINNDVVVHQEPPQQLPPMESLTIEPLPPMQAPLPMEQSSVEPALPPEQPQMFYQQPPRPITEMLGTGSFFFLQESEIDPTPEQIPSQTFTNQSFVTGHPPPPIPLPPHFQNMPPAAAAAAAAAAAVAAGMPPAMAPGGALPPNGGAMEEPPQQHLNGGGKPPQQAPPPQTEDHQQAPKPPSGNSSRPRPQPVTNNGQSYYNNNGYNGNSHNGNGGGPGGNRSNRQRSGGRSGNGRQQQQQQQQQQQH